MTRILNGSQRLTMDNTGVMPFYFVISFSTQGNNNPRQRDKSVIYTSIKQSTGFIVIELTLYEPSR